MGKNPPANAGDMGLGRSHMPQNRLEGRWMRGEVIGERGGDRSGKGTQSPAETAGGQSSSGGSEGVCTQARLYRRGPRGCTVSALHPL